MSDDKVARIFFEGLDIEVSRSQSDGKLVVDIETSNLDEQDTHPSGVPDIIIVVNEDERGISEDGEYIPRDC